MFGGSLERQLTVDTLGIVEEIVEECQWTLVGRFIYYKPGRGSVFESGYADHEVVRWSCSL